MKIILHSFLEKLVTVNLRVIIVFSHYQKFKYTSLKKNRTKY